MCLRAPRAIASLIAISILAKLGSSGIVALCRAIRRARR
jgi:hypothetical protein